MKARENALIILNKIENEGLYANLELKSGLVCEEKDKPLAVELIYGVLRYKINLDYVISLYSKLKPGKISLPVKNILRLSAYQILYLDKIPDSAACNEGVKLARKFSNKGAVSFVNAILRKISLLNLAEITYPSDSKEYLKFKYSFPNDIVEVFIRDYGIERTEELLSALNENKGVCVRPNLLKITFGEFEDRIKEKGIEYKVLENKAFLIKKAVNALSELMDEGFCSIQDRASMMTVELLNPQKGERVLDVCAAPGGKSCYMAELTADKAEIISCDLHKHRVTLIEKNALRLGITSIKAIQSDGTATVKEFRGAFDKILVDAPCSGLGVITKKPDIKWSDKNFNELSRIQYKILQNVSEYLKIGGKLVYSTCTVNKQENEEIVRQFIDNNKNFKVSSEGIQLFPCEEHDGFFMCCIERINNG